MKSSTRNKVDGVANIIKGDSKIAAGKLTRNRVLETKGRSQKIAGKIQRKVGKDQKAEGY
ncbi:MAG: CsbD family protein [Opitutaceae bacterium]